MAIDFDEPPEKAVYIKLTPGTDLYKMVAVCANHFGVKPAKAGRILIRGGYTGFTKSNVINLKRMKNESND